MIDLCKSLRRTRAALAIALAVLIVASGAPTLAQTVSNEEAARRIAEEFSVEVLRVRAAVIDNIPVWLVTVMKGGGNFNDAFQVATLAVDQKTGELVPEFRSGPNGYRIPAGQGRGTKADQRPEAMRSGTWR